MNKPACRWGRPLAAAATVVLLAACEHGGSDSSPTDAAETNSGPGTELIVVLGRTVSGSGSTQLHYFGVDDQGKDGEKADIEYVAADGTQTLLATLTCDGNILSFDVNADAEDAMEELSGGSVPAQAMEDQHFESPACNNGRLTFISRLSALFPGADV